MSAGQPAIARDDLSSAELALLEAVASELPQARFAFAFGSFGTPRFGSESDLDVAADFGRRLPSREFLDLSSRLSARVDRTVDLIDLRAADPIISMQVLRTGRPFLVRDPGALAVFRMTVPSRYFDWKASRRPVEEAMWAAARP